MLDEVNGRRFMVQAYLDTGRELDCRQPERCVHCFIEPFCTTMDRTMADQKAARFEVWQGDSAPTPLPFGCAKIGLSLQRLDDLDPAALPDGVGVELNVAEPGPIPGDLPRPARLIATTPAHLDAWLRAPRPDDVSLPDGVEIFIDLNRSTAPWMLEHRDRVSALADRLCIEQRSFEHLSGAAAHDVSDPAGFFRALNVRVATRGLAPCLAPGMILQEPVRRIGADLFNEETGRVTLRELARRHIAQHYHAKSVRCADCRVTERCEGIHINMIRDQGLARAAPLTDDPWADDAAAQLEARWPTPPQRVRDGRPLETPAPSLPGFAMPTSAPRDPLALIEEARRRRRAERAARAARSRSPAG